MIHRLWIPGYRPVPLNQIIGRQWFAVAKLKRADRQMIGTYAKIRGIPRAVGKRRVSLEIVLTGRQQETDPDALQKVLHDSLTHCGLLRDDSPKFCELGTVTFTRTDKREEAGTTIVLEDVEEQP